MHGGSPDEGFELNVIPMLDMFTILTIFLLMSYSTDPVNLEYTEFLKPPMSKTQDVLVTRPQINVAANEILLEDKTIVQVNPNTSEVVNRRANISQGAIVPLHEALKGLRENVDTMLKINEDNPQLKKVRSTIVMSADRNIKFKLIKQVMLTASQTEFIRFQLVVTRPQ